MASEGDGPLPVFRASVGAINVRTPRFAYFDRGGALG